MYAGHALFRIDCVQGFLYWTKSFIWTCVTGGPSFGVPLLWWVLAWFDHRGQTYPTPRDSPATEPCRHAVRWLPLPPGLCRTPQTLSRQVTVRPTGFSRGLSVTHRLVSTDFSLRTTHYCPGSRLSRWSGLTTVCYMCHRSATPINSSSCLLC